MRTRIRGKKSQATMPGAAKSAPHKQSVDSRESAEQTLFYHRKHLVAVKYKNIDFPMLIFFSQELQWKQSP